jgi:hypothetical protein
MCRSITLDTPSPFPDATPIPLLLFGQSPRAAPSSSHHPPSASPGNPVSTRPRDNGSAHHLLFLLRDTRVKLVYFPSPCHRPLPNVPSGPYDLEGNNTHPRRVAMLFHKGRRVSSSHLHAFVEQCESSASSQLNNHRVRVPIRFRCYLSPHGHIMSIHDPSSPLSIGNSRLALSLGHHSEFLMTPTSHLATSPDTRS